VHDTARRAEYPDIGMTRLSLGAELEEEADEKRRPSTTRNGGSTMTTVQQRCNNCGVPISDPTTRVIHGGEVYCCPNCSAAMEEPGSGSDPRAMEHDNDFICAHCGCAIVDRETMEERNGLAYCCANCARVGVSGAAPKLA
jgi:predicted RNA-binding Zn-ribbon protein involved in translation (DUF1610 family)